MKLDIFYLKTAYIFILFSILILFTSFCSKKLKEFGNDLFIDPGSIHDSLLPILITDDKNKFYEFEQALRLEEFHNINVSTYWDILFRYRDSALIPIYYKIIHSQDIHPYFKISAIYTLGEIAHASEFDNLYCLFLQEKNDLIREYLASALGKIVDTSHIYKLNKMLKIERNRYVQKTIRAAITRASAGRRIKFRYLPLIDTTSFRKIISFPSESTHREFTLVARKKLDTSFSYYIPMAKEFVFPHMQYKKCHSIYDKVKQPFASFGMTGVSHVGEDSGWLFAGMPVHSIMAGRVALVQHEESWGCLVCIESKLPMSEIICTYYGHLSSNLDVYIGKIIQMGDKIGEIGPAFSLQNGGYRSHLHLGIEKTSIGNALSAGYHDNTEHWYDPVKFILSKISK